MEKKLKFENTKTIGDEIKALVNYFSGNPGS